MGIESQLAETLYYGGKDRSYIDKVLSRGDFDEVKSLMAKEELSRKELSVLLYLLVSNELKLLKFNENDRYISGKFYVWIREFAQLTMQIYDYNQKIEKMSEEEKEFIGMTPDVLEMLTNIKRRYVHMVKYLVDIYFFLNRSTLSLENTGFDTLTKNRQETVYPEGYPGMGINLGQQKKGLIPWGR